jgi:hypothetical protein
MSAWKAIEHIEVPSGGTSNITFSSIPSTYTDLLIRYSLRNSSGSIDAQLFYFNNDTAANYSMRFLIGDGSSTGSYQNTSYLSQYNNWSIFFINPSGSTANTFNNTSVYLPNYASSSQFKIVSTDGATENNGTSAYTAIGTGIWRSNSPITSISITSPLSGTFVQYSSATLYGITKGSSGGVTVS